VKILIRKQDGNWKSVTAGRYSVEADLQELLSESPELISLEEIRPGSAPLCVAIREFGLPGSGQTDILAFNTQGDIVVVECKLAANAEIKRKVIAQVLEYGAYLWGMSYEELNQRVYKRSNQNLVDLVADAADDQDWDAEIFRQEVEESLSNGSFILVIAVDQMNDELRRTIRFINNCGNPTFAFTAFEMQRFVTDDTEILVPHVFGSSHPTPPTGERKQWTEKRYFDEIDAKLSTDASEVIKQLYSWSVETAHRIWFGIGAIRGSFTFHYLKYGNKTVSVFTIYTDGILVINYQWLSTAIEESTIQEFHETITKLPGFENIPADFQKFPTIRIDDVFTNRPDSIVTFKQAVEQIGKKIHKQI